MTAVSPTPIDDTAGIVLSTRNVTKAFSDVYPANSFVGNMLRMELLSRAGRSRQGAP